MQLECMQASAVASEHIFQTLCKLLRCSIVKLKLTGKRNEAHIDAHELKFDETNKKVNVISMFLPSYFSIYRMVRTQNSVILRRCFDMSLE